MVIIGSTCFVLVFVISLVQALKIMPSSWPEDAAMLGQLNETEHANITNTTSGSTSLMASLFRDAAPRLYDDSEVKRMIEKELGKKLEERMKFFPGMTSIQQLLEWNTTIAGPRLGPVKDLPQFTNNARIMSMHDMATGYNEMSDNDYLMLFQTWEAVDIFVYFSHVRIAVPPLQWTMVAHQHRRPALGTIIFEPGAETSSMVSEMLAKRNLVQDRLVSLADHYGFDGWFVNIENMRSDWPTGDPEKFVKELRHKIKKKLGKRAQIITYPYGPEDDMFKVSDGVFVNYNWGTDDESMHQLLKDAGSRAPDVYMGMDSFGGRRGDNEPDPKHVKVCAKNNLSIAVFAPGFTYEVEAKRKYSAQAVDFDHRYWSSIAENFGRPLAGTPKSGNTWPIPWKAPVPKAPEAQAPLSEHASTAGAVVTAGAVAAGIAGAALGAEIPVAAAAGITKVAGLAAGAR